MNLVKSYNIEILFQRRSKVGQNILNYLKENGYTKSGFALNTNISRPTLDKLINGEIDSKTTFNTHLQKIIQKYNISKVELLEDKVKNSDTPTDAFSDNRPKDKKRMYETNEMFIILDDIISLFEMYYKR
ncbi:hypothetical protein AN1V17_34530 [Vallitalea sediminicola]